MNYIELSCTSTRIENGNHYNDEMDIELIFRTTVPDGLIHGWIDQS